MEKRLEIAFQARIKDFPNKITMIATPPTGWRNRLKEEYDQIDQQCVGISRTTIFSYNEVLQTKEVLSDIKRLNFSDEDLTDDGRGELLKCICEQLAPVYGDSAVNMAIKRFWMPAEKYSDALLHGIQDMNIKLQEILTE
jgi:hypothetical protein